MKSSTPREWPFVRLDPKAFVADAKFIQLLQERSVPACCEDDRTLFRQGDPPAGLFIVHEGMVTLTMISENLQSLFSAHALPGSVLGLPAIVSDKPYSLTATVEPGARVDFLKRDDFNRLIRSQPLYSLKSLKFLASEVMKQMKVRMFPA